MFSAYIIFIVFFIGCRIIVSQNENPSTKKGKENPKFCILIPARDESLVIEDLLKSIVEQTDRIPMEDVYVIIESEKDKSLEIAKQYHASVFIRKHLERQRKGYALDECIKEMKKEYDAYFIFDADNILDKNYLKEMKKTYQEGYDLASGYRNLKNKEKSIEIASHLTFSILNGIVNEAKCKDTRNITLSGTGFFIRGEWIKKWQGFPFHELTEDYELTLYSILHDMTSTYNKKAIFFDEAPTTLTTSIRQRKRWIKGYFTTRKKYIQEIRKTITKNGTNNGSRYTEIIGITPIIFILIMFLIPVIRDILLLICQSTFLEAISILSIRILFIYGASSFLTLLLLMKEDKYLHITLEKKIKASIYHPFFLLTYVHAFLLSLLEKDVQWEKIEHQEKQKS